MTCQIKMSVNFISSIHMNKNKLEKNKKYSFNDFLENSTPDLKEKKIKRIDTSEVLGNFHSAYTSHCNIHAKLNGGIINFVYTLENYSRKSIIYGDTIDLNDKIFEEY